MTKCTLFWNQTESSKPVEYLHWTCLPWGKFVLPVLESHDYIAHVWGQFCPSNFGILQQFFACCVILCCRYLYWLSLEISYVPLQCGPYDLMYCVIQHGRKQKNIPQNFNKIKAILWSHVPIGKLRYQLNRYRRNKSPEIKCSYITHIILLHHQNIVQYYEDEQPL